MLCREQPVFENMTATVAFTALTAKLSAHRTRYRAAAREKRPK